MSGQKRKTHQEAVAPNLMDVHVGQRLRLRRLMARMSAQTLSERLDVQRNVVRKYEDAIIRMSAGRIYEAAVALDVAPGWFFDDFKPTSSPLAPTNSPDDVRALLASIETVRIAVMFNALPRETQAALLIVVEAMMLPPPAEIDGAAVLRDAAERGGMAAS